MLIGQLLLKLNRGGQDPGRTYAPKTGYFHDKTEISKANLQVNHYLQLKIFHTAMYLASPQLGQVTYKILSKIARF